MERAAAAMGSVLPVDTLVTIAWVLITLVVGFAVVRILDKATRRITRRAMHQRSGAMLEKFIRYAGNFLVVAIALRRAGVDITAVLGAAGIAGVALGFAAQTSVSNIISGLFLFTEKSFGLGDTVQVGDVTGVVESVELLSIQIRTFDNRLVRIPNETMIKSNIVNVTYWPRRRLDLWLLLPHGTKVPALREVFVAVADGNPLALKDPAPELYVDSANEDGLRILCTVWFNKADMAGLKNTLIPDLLAALEARGIRPQARRVEVGSGGASSAGGAGSAAT